LESELSATAASRDEHDLDIGIDSGARRASSMPSFRHDDVGQEQLKRLLTQTLIAARPLSYDITSYPHFAALHEKRRMSLSSSASRIFGMHPVPGRGAGPLLPISQTAVNMR